MDSWPRDYQGAWTLSKAFEREGIGLHNGKFSRVRVSPSSKPGINFSWKGQTEPPVQLKIEHVRESSLCTKLELGDKSVLTVEHLFAALIGCGLTHIHVELSGEEIPLLDGSAICWVDEIKKVGIVKAKTSRKAELKLETPILINRGLSVIHAIPCESFRVVGLIDFPYEAIGQQIFAVNLSPHNFVKEIAPARTFGFVDQIETLKKAGLIKGGDLQNALVCNGKSWLNPPLRFKDEPVRHKILDLIGDLALVGLPKAQILVYRGSHALHAEMAEALLKQCI